MNTLKIKCQAFEIELQSDEQTPQELADVFSKVVQTTPPILTIVKEAPQLPVRNKGDIGHEAPTIPSLPQEPVSQSKTQTPRGKGGEAQGYRKVVEMIEKGLLDEPKSQPEIRKMLATAGYNISPKRLPEALLHLVREGHLTREGGPRTYKYRRAPATENSGVPAIPQSVVQN